MFGSLWVCFFFGGFWDMSFGYKNDADDMLGSVDSVHFGVLMVLTLRIPNHGNKFHPHGKCTKKNTGAGILLPLPPDLQLGDAWCVKKSSVWNLCKVVLNVGQVFILTKCDMVIPKTLAKVATIVLEDIKSIPKSSDLEDELASLPSKISKVLWSFDCFSKPFSWVL